MNLPSLKMIITFLVFLCNGEKVKKIEVKNLPQLPETHKEESTLKLFNSLKQLEFISYFENQIQNNNEDQYSLEFLQELDYLSTTSKNQAFNLIRNAVA